MVLRGKVQNGVVILEPGTVVPEGADVSVYVAVAGAACKPLPEAGAHPAASDVTREKRKAALAELLALPDENPGDRFTGADLDQALYGESE